MWTGILATRPTAKINKNIFYNALQLEHYKVPTTSSISLHMGSSSRKRSRETYRPSASPHTDDLCRKVLKANANARIPTPAAASLDYKSADKSGSDRSSKSKETLGSGIAGSVVKITTDTSTYVRKKVCEGYLDIRQ